MVGQGGNPDRDCVQVRAFGEVFKHINSNNFWIYSVAIVGNCAPDCTDTQFLVYTRIPVGIVPDGTVRAFDGNTEDCLSCRKTLMNNLPLTLRLPLCIFHYNVVHCRTLFYHVYNLLLA